MKVYKFNQWGREDGEYHGVETKEWKKGQYKLLTLHFEMYCGKTYTLQPRDKYEEYKKDDHRKSMCKDCVKAIQAILASRRKVN